MSDPTPHSNSLSLPDRPDLRHLKDQARDLFKAGEAATLSHALYKIATRYGYASWPRLKAYVESLSVSGELKNAIDSGDYQLVRRMMKKHPDLHTAPIGYNKNGPLTWVAECRIPRVPPSADRLSLAAWMIENGSDVHQGGDGPLMRAALDDDRIAMMELLVSYGADVNALWNGSYPVICAPCESLAPLSLAWLLAHGADPTANSSDYGSPLAMLIATYSRNAAGKQACLEVLARAGYEPPNTPPMALARGRIDLLEANLKSDPQMLERRFSYSEIYPEELGIKPGEGLTSTPLDGTTLLHQAIEFEDTRLAQWLLERGADPNARAAIDVDGFGGHAPLHHTVIAMGDRTKERAHLLLEHGADPNQRATFRKQLASMGEPEKERMFEYHDATPIAYARMYQEPAWVNEPAIQEIAARGGVG